MQIRGKFLINILSVFLLALVFTLFSSKNTYAANFQLQGTVQDSSGNAIAGSTIDVFSLGTTNDVVPPITSDQSSNYSFTDIPQGTYTIKVTPPAGSSFTSAVVLSKKITSDTILNFVLVPSGTSVLSGHVFNPQGNPVSGQRVILFSDQGVAASTQTDASGSYSLQATSGTYAQLQIRGSDNAASLNIPESYYLVAQNYPLMQSTVQDITIPAKQVAIHVQDAFGNSVAGVNISTQLGETSGFNLGTGVTNAIGSNTYDSNGPKTDNSGDVVLWLLAGTYTFNATPPSGRTLSQTTLSNISVSTTLTQETITLTQPVLLNGHVYDTQGDPIPGQTVALFPNSGSSISTLTDSFGSYSLQANTGTYAQFDVIGSNNSSSFHVPQNYYVDNLSYTLAQNTTQDITIPTKQVTIHVQDSLGNPEAGVNITTHLGETSGFDLGGGLINAIGSDTYNSNGPVTDSSGNVTLWLLNGTYTFTANPASGSIFTQTTLSNIAILSDSQETITLSQPVTLNGHVYNAQGDPVSGQRVMLLSDQGVAASTQTDASGSYSLQATSGTYAQLQIRGSNNDSSLNIPESYFLVVPNYSLMQNSVQDITIPAKQITIHVQDSLGNPVIGVGVTTHLGETSGFNLGNGVTNAIGSDTYDSNGPKTDNSGDVVLWLLAGTYSFNATPPGGSIYSPVNINNIIVSGNQSELISLQYSHSTPVTTASLSTQRSDGAYTDPTTVTLSASATSGYTIANTYYSIDGGAQQTYSSPFTITGNGNHSISYWSVDNSGVQESHNSKSFTIVTTHNLTGTVYVDANQNGFQDTGESGFGGATVTLNSNQTVTTDANGHYSFADLPADTYVTSLTLPSGYAATTTNPANVALNADTTQNFGIAPVPTNTPTATPIPTNAPPVITSVTAPVTTVQVNTAVTLNANFTDQNTSDTHTANWNWGDGTTSTGTVTESNGSGSITKQHTYTTSGVYTVSLTVKDSANATASQDFQYITVYDPANGWATGDKEYTSQSGALSGNPSATGKADFGFTAKYVNGMLQPIGSKWASVSFDAGNIDFLANSYSSLVITNNKIILRGTGTLNGASGYSVLISAIDNGTQGTSYIRYQIKNSSGTIIYDTQPGAADTANPNRPINKGKIQIH